VTLTFNQGVLTATGSAPQQWIDETQRLAPAIAGVREFKFAGEPAEARLVAMIERARIGFAKAQSTIDPAWQPAVASLVAHLQQLDAALASSGRRARLEIDGYADSDGPDGLNAALSQARADRVRQALASAALANIDLSARGLGRAPLLPGATEAQHEQNRRATFRVHMTNQPPGRREPQ
jgi:OOP family OmpA-OmpF porin